MKIKNNLLDSCPIFKLAVKSLERKGFKFKPKYYNEYDGDYTHHLPDVMEEATLILNILNVGEHANKDNISALKLEVNRYIEANREINNE